MRRIPVWGWALAATLVAGLLFLVLHKTGSGDAAEQEPQVTATITVAQARAETLATTLRAYGAIQPAADGAATVAAPKAAVVTQLLVSVGQPVRAGQPLLQIANAPAAQQAYRQAADAVAFAQTDLARVQRLAGEHLAANDQLSAAQKTLADARAALAAQQAGGAGRMVQTVVAPAAAVVTAVQVRPGDRVAQDSPLLVLARAGALVANLNIPSDAAGAVAPGDAASVSSAFGGAAYAGRLVTVGRLSDPTTRMIQAIAPVPADAFPVAAAVQADIVTGTHQGLLVPRAAVVFDETGTHLFTVSAGKAHRVFVQAGASHGQDVEVSGQISAGTPVAVQGAYELQDGMSVRTAGR
jgi:RND family efflux transporter MFP subunit